MTTQTKFLFTFTIACMFILQGCTPASVPTTVPDLPQTTSIETSARGDNNMILATTTSTEDSGLLDYLLPVFESEAG